LFDRTGTGPNLLRNETQNAIVSLDLRQQGIGEFPKLRIVVLITHGFEDLHCDLRTTEVIAATPGVFNLLREAVTSPSR